MITDAAGIDVNVELSADAATLLIAGEIDIATVDGLAASVAQVRSFAEPNAVVLDLAGVSFMDGAGVSALLAIHRECQNRSIAMRLANPPPCVQRVLIASAAAHELAVDLEP